MTKPVLLLAAATLVSARAADAQQAGQNRCTTHVYRAGQTVNGQSGTAARQWIAAGDSLAAEVRTAARQAGIAQPAGLVVLAFNGRDRSRPDVSTPQSNVPERTVRQVLARYPGLVAAAPAESDVVFFSLDSVAAPTLVEGTAVEECRPAPVNQERFLREIEAIQRRAERTDQVQSGPTQVNLRILVSRDGSPAHVTVVRRSGWPAVERMVVDAARWIRFDPATINGTPVEAWVELPIVLVIHGGFDTRRP